MAVRILQGDCRDVLATLPAGSVQCVVTSPPYFNLRDYGTASWDGGGPACDHRKTQVATRGETFRARGKARGYAPGSNFANYGDRNATASDFEYVCGRCGATRVDRQIGLEATPEAYVATLVDVFRAVRRVLRDDGTVWCNLGDGFEDKQLQGMPWRVAFALQADGWFLRSDIIWAKPNPMPESVTDRPTKAHEYVFLLTKSARYVYDADAVREPHDDKASFARFGRVGKEGGYQGGFAAGRAEQVDGHTRPSFACRPGARVYHPAGRNLRSVWTIPSEPTPDAHFATFPRKLVAPCIKAGTSERGCCATCGAPWARVVATTPMVIDRSSRTHALGRTRASGTVIDPGSSVTTGWQPTCDHDAPVVPCVVLDPFGGTGTVGRVAEDLGRDSILIELNADYVALARRKTAQLGLFAGRADDGA